MKLRIFSLGLLLIALSSSCKKDSLLITENADIPILSKVLIDNETYYEYIFNNENLIIEGRSKFSFATYFYNEKNQLVTTCYYGDNALLSSDTQVAENALTRSEWVNSANSVRGGSVSYEYNSNEQLIKATFSHPSGNNSEYSEFSYDSGGKISRQTLYWENNISGYIDYSYDTRGNLIKEILYSVYSTGIAELNTITAYEFDNEQNPYRSFNKLIIPGINTNRNNIVKETLTIQVSAEKGSEMVQETKISYTYNGKGYPIRKNGIVEYLYK